MSRRIGLSLAALSLPLLAPFSLPAQQGEPTVYTYVAEWRIARGQQEAFMSHFDQHSKPVLDRLVSDGTLTEWARGAEVVHTEGGMTHSVWWAGSTIAGVQKALDELAKLPPNPSMSGIEKHRDQLLRSIVYRARGSGHLTGFIHLSNTRVKSGKGREWRELWDKYAKPTYEELFNDGTLVAYGIDAEWLHTDDPGNRFVWHITANAAGIDKVEAAFAARRAKETPESGRAIAAAFADVTVGETHRDGLSYLTHYVRK